MECLRRRLCLSLNKFLWGISVLRTKRSFIEISNLITFSSSCLLNKTKPFLSSISGIVRCSRYQINQICSTTSDHPNICLLRPINRTNIHKKVIYGPSALFSIKCWWVTPATRVYRWKPISKWYRREECLFLLNLKCFINIFWLACYSIILREGWESIIFLSKSI